MITEEGMKALVFLLLWVVLSGCVSKEKEILIKVWEFPRWRCKDGLDRFFWIKEKIKEFERMNPGVDIELTELSWERGEDKIRIAVASGYGPDIITGTLPIRYIEEGLIEPVDPYLKGEDLKDYYKGALEGFCYKGKVYGWPWFMTGVLMFVNLELFEKRGIHLPRDGRWRWSEFIRKIKSLTYDSDGDEVVDTYGFGFVVSPGDPSLWPIICMDKGEILSCDLKTFTLNSKEGFSGLRKLYELKKFSPPGAPGMKPADLWQLFLKQGKVACAPWGIWAIPALKKEEFPFGVMYFPTGERGEPITFVATSGFIIFRQKDPEKRKMCMEFARFLTNSENQRALKDYGVFPTRKSTGNIYEGDPWMSRAGEIFKDSLTLPPHPKWLKIDEKIKRNLQLALLGEKSLHEAMSDAAKEIEKILKEPIAFKEKESIHPSIYLIGVPFLLILILLLRRKTSMFILPSIVVIAVFLAFPLFRAFLLAFQRFEIGQGIFEGWVGFSNFRDIFQDKIFWKALFNTVIYTGITVPGNLLVALLLASLLYPLSKRLKAVFRPAYYLPGVTSVVVISMIWRWLYDPNFGLLNQMLKIFGLEPIMWLTDPDIALYSIILTTLLRTPGGPILIYLAAMEAIPSSLYEASKIDGAGAFRRWWSITLPLLKPTTLFLLVTLTITSFQVFGQVMILTDGGPGYATSVLVHRIYEVGFRDFEFGVASAMALILFGVIVGVSVLQFKFFRHYWEY
jgi:multiple sugar transport system permease protein